MSHSISTALLEKLSEPFGHVRCDAQLFPVQISAKLPSILGWTEDSAEGSVVVRTPCSAGSTIALQRTLMRALRGEAAADLVLLFFHNPNRVVEVAVTPIGDPGKPEGLELLCRDMSWYYEENRQRKAMIRIAERISQWVHVAALAIQFDTGDMFGSFLVPDLLGLPRSVPNFNLEEWLRRVSPDQVDRFTEQVHALYNGSIEHLQETIHYTVHGDHCIWLQVEGSVLHHTQEGDRPAMLLLFQDVTQKHQSELEHERLQNDDNLQTQLGNWSIDVNTGAEHWSDELLRIHNIPSSRKVKSLFDIFETLTAEDQRLLLNEFHHPAMEGGIRSHICHLQLPDGVNRHIHVRWEYHFENGKLSQINGTSLDISELLHASRRLRENEENNQLMMSALPDMLLIIEAHTRKIWRSNNKAQELLGMSRRSLLNRTLGDLCDDNDELTLALAKGDGQPISVKFYTANGETLPCEVRVVCININAQDLRMLMARDLRAIERLQKNLWEIQERFHQIADNTNDIFWLIDPNNGHLLYANHAFWSTAQIPVSENYPLDTRTLGIYDDQEMAQGWEAMQQLVRGESRQVVFEHHVLRKDGIKRIIRATCFPVKDPAGNVIRLGGICTDITPFREAMQKQKMQEEQLRQADKMTSLGVLVSGVAHEINNPNNLIMMNAALLTKIWKDLLPILEREFELNPDLRLNRLPYSVLRVEMIELLHGLTEGSERIRTIVHGLKEFVRMDSGRLNERVSLAKVIDDALLIVGNVLRKKTMNLYIDKGPSDILVKGNAQQLEQVLINLLTNAAEALRNGNEMISIECVKESPAAILRVTDQGMGIPAAIMGKIQDPFFTTKREHGGTGLGLAVSYGIMEAHGGALHFSSIEGKGTVAEMRLPLLSEDHNGQP